MEDEILEFNYRNPKSNGHRPDCSCLSCTINRPPRKKPKSFAKAATDRKIKITIPRIDIPQIMFGGPTQITGNPLAEKSIPNTYMHNGVSHPIILNTEGKK
jgi:hypothetical protein